MAGGQLDLKRVRERFVISIVERHDQLEELLDKVAMGGGDAPLLEAQQILHKVAGIAGAVGFARLGEAARKCDELIMAQTDGVSDVSVEAVLESVEDYLDLSLSTCQEEFGALAKTA